MLAEKIMNTVYGSIMTSPATTNQNTPKNTSKITQVVNLEPPPPPITLPQYHQEPTRQKSNIHYCPECSTSVADGIQAWGHGPISMNFSSVGGNVCYLCDQCGFMEEIIGDNSEFDEFSTALLSGYNISSSSTVPIKMTGPQSSNFQRRIISGTTEYKNTQRKVTFDEMAKLNSQEDIIKVPPHIVNAAAKDYCKLQQHYIRRGDVRRGIMGWLVYELCKESGIDRTPDEISTIFKIPSDELSNGSKVVKQARVDGILEEIGCNGYDAVRDMECKLKRYFGMFGISEVYIPFAQTVIDFVIKKRKKAIHSGMKARCTGVIYVLGLSLDLYISKQQISDTCHISITTFSKFINYMREIMTEDGINAKKLKHIFNKHSIPLINF